jgi:glycerophosphoryl diester phosphodiesterase
VAFACAHRGLSSEKAENTLAAFGAAVAAGFPAFEMDLRTAADGEVVVLHDADLDRTTDGHGRIDAVTSGQLRSFETPDGPVPRLDDLLRSLCAWDGLWNLELKARSALAPTVELVRRHKLGPRALLSAMDTKVLAEAAALAPEIARAAIPMGPVDDSDLEKAKASGCTWLNVDHDFLDADEAQKVRAAGFRLGAWTVNDVARAQELVGMGVECVITDARAVGDALRGPAPTSW